MKVAIRQLVLRNLVTDGNKVNASVRYRDEHGKSSEKYCQGVIVCVHDRSIDIYLTRGPKGLLGQVVRADGYNFASSCWQANAGDTPLRVEPVGAPAERYNRREIKRLDIDELLEAGDVVALGAFDPQSGEHEICTGVVKAQ